MPVSGGHGVPYQVKGPTSAGGQGGPDQVMVAHIRRSKGPASRGQVGLRGTPPSPQS